MWCIAGCVTYVTSSCRYCTGVENRHGFIPSFQWALQFICMRLLEIMMRWESPDSCQAHMLGSKNCFAVWPGKSQPEKATGGNGPGVWHIRRELGKLEKREFGERLKVRFHLMR